MCISVSKLHTCGHATYEHQRCSSTADLYTCPYLEDPKTLEFNHPCAKCGATAADLAFEEARAPRSEAKGRREELRRERGKVEKSRRRPMEKETNPGCCTVQ